MACRSISPVNSYLGRLNLPVIGFVPSLARGSSSERRCTPRTLLKPTQCYLRPKFDILKLGTGEIGV